MSSPATVGDLQDRWRPLSALETTNGTAFLNDAWGMLKRQVPGLLGAMESDADLVGEVIRVLCSAVLRVMKNPDGKRQESIDDYSWTRDQALSAGQLYFTDAELDALATDPSTRSPAFSFSLLPVDYPGSRFP